MNALKRAMRSVLLLMAGCLLITGGVSAEEFSYDDYAAVLSSFVDNNGMVDYARLKGQRARLDRFVAGIGELGRDEYESWSDKGRIAFWINAYNALTLRAIIDHYPIKSSFSKSLVYPKNSIRQIDGVWDKLKFTVMGQAVTLDHIEHGIIRPKYRDPRVHMALVCAAMSCPILRDEPFRAEKLDAQFEDQARRFLANNTKFMIDVQKKRIHQVPGL